MLGDMTFRLRLSALFLTSCVCALHAHPVRALEIKVSAKALERTLQKQLFNGEGGRHYIKGKAGDPCFIYAEDPEVSFAAERVVVHIKRVLG